ncbi:DUF4837 family protein [candidate division KSB1 bacterium]|nr:DUF4837 family protein [candidate division KSB1 bacterium]
MNKKAVLLPVIFILSVAFMLSCGMKRDSLGSRDKIIIIADSTQWVELEEHMLAALERIIYTPQPEPIFNLLRRGPEDLNKLSRFPNLLIIGSLDIEGQMNELLHRMLSEEAMARVQADSAFLFNKPDPWARDQLLVLAVSRDIETLKQNVRDNSDRLFNLFDENLTKYVFKTLFTQFEQKEISKALMDKHGWNVRVQHDYFVAADSSEIRYVWLRRFNPQRWLSVTWEPVEDPSLLSREWMLEKRREVIEKFYDGDYVYEDETINVQEKIVDFKGRYAIRLDGVWQNEIHVMGGPFRSYGFYNEGDGRLYLIDLAVYAPGERKYQYLRQLDGIASTFRTKNEQTRSTE